MPEHISIEVAPGQKVTGIVYAAAKARRAGIGLILGPGAGAPQTSGFMVTFASELAARGIDVVTLISSIWSSGGACPIPMPSLKRATAP